MVLLSAGKSRHRNFSVDVVGRDAETGEILRIGIARRDHDSHWEVRFAQSGDLVEWTIGPHPGIRLIGPPKHGLVPQALARTWARPTKGLGVFGCPFILEQSHHDRPSIMVIGDCPGAELELIDPNDSGNESTLEQYIDLLFCRADFVRWESKAVRTRSKKHTLFSFSDFMAGADNSTFDLDSNIGEKVGGRAPYPVLYTWLTATPSVAGQRARRKVATPTEDEKDDENEGGRIRHLVLAFKPDIIVASGEEVIRGLGLILRPIIDQARRQPHVTFRHDLANTPANVSLWDAQIIHFRDGYFRHVIPVYDLRFFRQRKAHRRVLPENYWSMFCAVFRDRIGSRQSQYLPDIAPVAGKTYWF